MRIYLEVALRAFRRYTTYRAATAAGVFTNTIFGFIRAYVLIALWRARPDLGGYDVTDAVTFCFLTQGLLVCTGLMGPALDLAQRIRTGDVAIDLYRPVDFQGWWLASDLGRGVFQLVFRGIPPMLVGILAFPIRLPATAGMWCAFVGSLLLGIVIAFGVRYIVALSAFWLLDDRGVNAVAMIAGVFFSGMMLPLVVFPGWLGVVANLTPWAAMVQLPADVFLGKHTGVDLALALGLQAVWAVLLLGVGRILTVAATRRVVAQGG